MIRAVRGKSSRKFRVRVRVNSHEVGRPSYLDRRRGRGSRWCGGCSTKRLRRQGGRAESGGKPALAPWEQPEHLAVAGGQDEHRAVEEGAIAQLVQVDQLAVSREDQEGQKNRDDQGASNEDRGQVGEGRGGRRGDEVVVREER